MTDLSSIPLDDPQRFNYRTDAEWLQACLDRSEANVQRLTKERDEWRDATYKLADAHTRLVDERKAAEARIVELARDDLEADVLIVRMHEEALQHFARLRAAEAEVARLRGEHAQMVRMFRQIAETTPHVRGCDEPDDHMCARCIADSEVARAALAEGGSE